MYLHIANYIEYISKVIKNKGEYTANLKSFDGISAFTCKYFHVLLIII